MTDNKNQPAFPNSNLRYEDGSMAAVGFGLTKREYAAIQIMKGLLAHPRVFEEYQNRGDGIYDDSSLSIYEKAVTIADKLLKKLEH